MVMEALEAAGLINAKQMNLKRFRIDLKEMAEPFYGRALENISVKDVYDQIMRLIFKYRIVMPRNLLLLLKTFIQTEALGKILGSDASLLEVTRPYARKLLEQGYDAQKLIRNVGRDMKSAGGYLRWMPKLTHDIFKRIAGGDHRLELNHGGLDPVTKKFERGLNRLTVGLVVSASLIAASLILNSAKEVLPLELGILGLGAIDITDLLGLTGYCIATFLGIWLVISIIRSGKL
jgi:ubiquinone biosynthesis protein